MKFWGWLSFLIPLGIYLASMSTGVGVWDTAELETVPYIFGIAHPTGFPAYVLLGWVFSHAVAVSTVAWRISLLSALCGSACAALVYALARRLQVPAGTACGAALLFAVGQVAWTRGTRAEVHTLATLEILVAVAATFDWYATGNARRLVLAALAVGLGLATHPVVVLIAPGIAVLALARRPFPSLRTIAVCAVAAFAPLATYAYIPLRAAYVTAHRVDPTLSLGIPPGRPYWDYGNPATLGAFLHYVSGTDFHAASTVASILDPLTYLAVAPRAWNAVVWEFPPAALLLALVGFVVLLRRRPVVPLALALALLPAVPFAYAYHAESDSDRYALPAFALIAVLVACAVTAIASALAADNRRSRDLTAFLAMLVLAGSEFWAQRDVFRQRTDSAWAGYVDRIRSLTPPNSIIVADWAFATPLAYAAFVERSMGDRIIETAHPADDAHFLKRWLLQRPVYIVTSPPPAIPGVKLDLVSEGEPDVFRVGTAH